ncbi:MAG TPA: hypothetical protein VIL01_11195 [Thermomicrobiales bacterium]
MRVELEETMVISEPAFAVLEDTGQALLTRVTRLVRRRRAQRAWFPQLGPTLATPDAAGVWTASVEPAQETKPRGTRPAFRSLAARLRPSTPDFAERTPEQRRAWAIAHRGLARARDGQIDAAREDFTQAVTLDPSLDLSTLPGFWRLSQQAHQAAVEAYEAVGRFADAAALTAAVRAMFRPRPLVTRPHTRSA